MQPCLGHSSPMWECCPNTSTGSSPNTWKTSSSSTTPWPACNDNIPPGLPTLSALVQGYYHRWAPSAVVKRTRQRGPTTRYTSVYNNTQHTYTHTNYNSHKPKINVKVKKKRREHGQCSNRLSFHLWMSEVKGAPTFKYGFMRRVWHQASQEKELWSDGVGTPFVRDCKNETDLMNEWYRFA